jgi:hypothetical protein
MGSVFLITKGRMLFSHPLQRMDGTYKTCVVTTKDYMTAQSIITDMKHGKRVDVNLSIYRNDDLDDLEIKEIQLHDEAFYKMLHLNNFAILIADDVHFIDSKIGINGDMIDIDYDISDENRHYLDTLLKKMSE